MRLIIILLALVSSTAFSQLIHTINGPKATGYLGFNPDMPTPRYRAFKVHPSDLPESFNWSDHVEALAIKDQGNCGSCWAQAVTRSFEYALAIQQNKAGLDLSEQELVSCDKTNYGCSGGYMQSAGYAVRHGQGLEKDFPYAAKNLRCKVIPVAEKASNYMLIGAAGRAPAITEMKAALIQHGPLFVTVAAGGPGWNGSTGKVTGCRNSRTNHMVVISGYDKEGNWIMDNSWGTDWGDSGYTKIKFGCDKIGVQAGFYILDQLQ